MTLEDAIYAEDLPDDGGEVLGFEVDGLRVEREQGCYRLLTWRCQPKNDLDPCRVDALRGLMLQGPYDDRSRHPNLVELERNDRHRIIIVRTTGRTQIRIDYEVAEAQREEAARSVSADLAHTLARLETRT